MTIFLNRDVHAGIHGLRMAATVAGCCVFMSCALAEGAPSTENSGVEAAAGNDQLAEVVVTAQKRSENLQNVPVAITAITSGDLARSGVTDLTSLQSMVPNLNIGTQLGLARINLRGIGLENLSTGAEGSIAMYTDGVFISRPVAALASFYDVDRVEVLRGPQGTLYGRNATGGSINIITREPTEELEGYINVTAGNYSSLVTEGAISGALIDDKLLARIAFQTQQHDGYGTNLVTGDGIDDLNTRSIRASFEYKATEELNLELTADYRRESDHAGGYHFLGGAGFSAPGVPITVTGLTIGGQVSSNSRDIDNPNDPTNDQTFSGVLAKVTYDFSNFEVKSLTAFRTTNYVVHTDLDPTTAGLALIEQLERDNQFSEELQISGHTEKLNWLGGVFYFHENDTGGIFVPFNNYIVGFPQPGTFVQGSNFGGILKTDAEAVFGQASYEIVSNLKLTIGGRYSSEKKSVDEFNEFNYLTPYDPTGPITGKTDSQNHRWNDFTPRVALDYQVDPDVLLYGSFAKGFKSGTFNLGALQPPVNPEKVNAYEAGLKSTLYDRRIRANIAGFYYDYSDLQVGKVVNNILELENAASAKIYGVEGEFEARVTSRFEVDANLAWLHARFSQYVSQDPSRPFGDGHTVDPVSGEPAFNLADNALSQAPNFTAFLGAQYTLPTSVGALTLRGEGNYRDRVYFTPFNVSYLSQGSYAKVNAFLKYVAPSEKWHASIFIKNIANRTTISNAYISTTLLGSPINGFLDDPRTYGVTIGYVF
jgi:iron complex outermembrane receptor protein